MTTAQLINGRVKGQSATHNGGLLLPTIAFPSDMVVDLVLHPKVIEYTKVCGLRMTEGFPDIRRVTIILED